MLAVRRGLGLWIVLNLCDTHKSYAVIRVLSFRWCSLALLN